MNTKDFLQLANKQRLDNKDTWIFLTEYVNGKELQYKAFNTWVQFIKVGNFKDSSNMNLNVSEFKNYITDTLNYIKADKYNQV